MNSDRYCLLATLDKSNSGTTLLAKDKGRQKFYAIKILKKEFTMDVRLEDNFPVGKQHPFILDFEGSFNSPSCVHLVMEFAAGGYLMWHIQRDRFEFGRACLYAAELCLAVKFFHENGIVHRDLTLENIMLASDGHIKVCGFEMCKGSMWHNKTSTFCGNSSFPAPEVLLDRGYGRSVDWWLFGIIIYQMVLSHEPFLGEEMDEIYDAILNTEPAYPTAMSTESVSIIQQLLIKQPEGRLGSSTRDALDVMEHPFFKGFDWQDVYHKRVPVSFKPDIKDEGDLSYFGLDQSDSNVLVKPCNDW